MINAFRDASGVVQIASRSKLGATGTFYSKRPFSALLEDALKSKGQDLQTILPADAEFGSFLLQHPEHRIVALRSEPALHLIHTGTVAEDGTVHIQENEALESVTLPSIPTTVLEFQQVVAQLAEQRGYMWQGLVLKDGQGGRWRWRSNCRLISCAVVAVSCGETMITTPRSRARAWTSGCGAMPLVVMRQRTHSSTARSGKFHSALARLRRPTPAGCPGHHFCASAGEKKTRGAWMGCQRIDR
jgi:hypothetical protein